MEYTKNYDFIFVCTCLYMSYIRYIPACTWFIHFHPVSYLEKTKPFSAQSISLRHAIRTRLNSLHTMLYYASVQESAFCTCRVHTGLYPLRMALAGGQLSYGISSKTRTYAFVTNCQRLYMVSPCTVTSVHEKGKMPQNCLNMYIHVCIMFRHVCTVLPILVQVVRIPDDYFGAHSVCTGMYLSVLLYTGIS